MSDIYYNIWLEIEVFDADGDGDHHDILTPYKLGKVDSAKSLLEEIASLLSITNNPDQYHEVKAIDAGKLEAEAREMVNDA